MKLPGILSIACMPCALLPEHLVAKCLTGATITITEPEERLLLYGDAECTIKESFQYGGDYQEVELTFSTISDVPISTPTAFLIRCINGERYVIGSDEAPYPLVEVTEMVEPLRHVSKVKVTLNSPVAAMRVVF